MLQIYQGKKALNERMRLEEQDSGIGKRNYVAEEKDYDFNCSSSWPNLQLFLPIAPSHYHEFQQELLRSLLFFWPKRFLNMLVVLDEGRSLDPIRTALKEETKGFNKIVIKSNKPSPFYGFRGYDRQQLIMFFADNFTNSEYVGFLDTDTFFVSPVSQGDLFEDGKPVVIGFRYVVHHRWWKMAAHSTEKLLGSSEQFRCMSHFPVIIKTEHLIRLRQFVQGKHGISFNEYFRSFLKKRPYSQFNIMCNYLWYHHRDEYAWHIQLISMEDIEPQMVTEAEQKFGKSLLYPKPRVAIHSTYHYMRGLSSKFFSGLMAVGYCYDARARNLKDEQEWCQNNNIRLPDVNPHMFKFEGEVWDYHPKINESFQLRQQRLARCPPHKWHSKESEKMFSDIGKFKKRSCRIR